MLNLSDVTFAFGGNVVLQDFTYRFEQGNIYALMGANGSGKTTLFNLIGGFLTPQKGEITFKGKSIKNMPPHKIASMGISRTFQDMRLIPTLSVYENVLLAIKYKPTERLFRAFFTKADERYRSKIEVILERTHLSGVADELASNISYGQQKLLNLAVALANDFEVLLLDEPVAGVQPEYREQILHLVKSFDKTVIVIEHNPEFLEVLTERILFLDGGKVVAEGDYATIKETPVVQEAYL